MNARKKNRIVSGGYSISCTAIKIWNLPTSRIRTQKKNMHVSRTPAGGCAPADGSLCLDHSGRGRGNEWLKTVGEAVRAITRKAITYGWLR